MAKRRVSPHHGKEVSLPLTHNKETTSKETPAEKCRQDKVPFEVKCRRRECWWKDRSGAGAILVCLPRPENQRFEIREAESKETFPRKFWKSFCPPRGTQWPPGSRSGADRRKTTESHRYSGSMGQKFGSLPRVVSRFTFQRAKPVRRGLARVARWMFGKCRMASFFGPLIPTPGA